jgi:beta-galactosidase
MLLSLSAVFCASAQQISCNENWIFSRTGDIPSAQEPLEDADWRKVELPHTWNREDAFDDGIDGYYRGPGVYRKSLFIDASQEGKNVFLHFEGANQEATLFVNGAEIGTHIGGYTEFMFDITSAVQFGTNNLLTVLVDNSHNVDIPPLSADFTFYGGIYRPVHLLFREPVHFDLLDGSCRGTYHHLENASEQSADVVVAANLSNKSGAGKYTVRTEILDADRKVVARSEKSVELPAGKSRVEDTLRIENPELWSPDSPTLYSRITTLVDAAGREVDMAVAPLGVRWFGLDDNKNFLLNGKPLKLSGVNRHQDFEGFANALPDQIHENDVKMMKELGCNFLRMAHYPQSKRVYEACDRYGILVWEEIPIVNRITESDAFAQNSHRMLEEMTLRSFNHPCILMRGFMNEVRMNKGLDEAAQESYRNSLKSLARSLNAELKRLDPRCFTAIANDWQYSWYESVDLNSICDVIGFNLYFGWYYGKFEDLDTFIAKFKAEHPDKVYFQSEYNAGGDARLHSFEPEPYDFSCEYQKEFSKYYLNFCETSDLVAGSAAWNFADFGSERRRDALPHINQKGILNFDRSPKDLFYYYQAVWLDRPVLKIASTDWNYRIGEGQERCTQRVNVYSNAKEVELFLDGESLGRQAPVLCDAVFEVPFADGVNTLTARAVVDGQEIADELEIDFNLIPSNLQAPLAKDFKLNVNIGSKCFFVDPVLREAWMPGKAYSPGSHGFVGGEPLYRQNRDGMNYPGSSARISSTKNDPLYQTMLAGIESYRFDVPDGDYELTLHFAELISAKQLATLVYEFTEGEKGADAPISREFDVSVNGTPVLSRFAPGRDYADFEAIAKTVPVSVCGGKGILIDFTPRTAEPILNAIQLRKLD